MARLYAGFWIAISAVALMGQSGTTTITGIVKDATGAPLPNASISITNIESGVQVATQTNGDGIYRAAALLPGSYRLEVAAARADRIDGEPNNSGRSGIASWQAERDGNRNRSRAAGRIAVLQCRAIGGPA